ncbi:MAG: gliding motility protein GldN [Flavobacteriaceae bacterium]|nr:gliding motility protein GldN [Flavobacteriaceae bacterium]
MKSVFTYLLVGSIGLFTFSNAVAQSNILNAKTPVEVGELTEDQKEYDDDKPLDYGYVGDRDILWSKTVWEKIDLQQKVNFPLYYPTKRTVINKNRRPLFQVLVDGIKDGASGDPSDKAIKQIYRTSYFDEDAKLVDEEALARLSHISLPDAAYNILDQYGITGTETVDLMLQRFMAGTLEDYPELYPQELLTQLEPFLIPEEITALDIEYYHIKGIWYFDKRQGEMRYRILALAPVGVDVKKKGSGDEGEPIEYFWVWYPDARNALHHAKVLNNQNSSKPLSFDHILNSRRFNAVIYQTENEYGDREIKDYVQDDAMMQLLEADRLKEEIRNFELDMWNH